MLRYVENADHPVRCGSLQSRSDFGRYDTLDHRLNHLLANEMPMLELTRILAKQILQEPTTVRLVDGTSL